MKDKFVIIFVTFGSVKEASRVTSSLLAKRLIACANIVSGVESKFWWQGYIDSARETLAIMKTRAGNFNKIEKEVKRLHSYEVPEIIAIPIAAGSKKYLEWINNSVRI